MSDLIKVDHKISMTTVEIAEQTGKQHAHVKRDTEKMLKEVVGKTAVSKFGESYEAKSGMKYDCYRLPKREIMILVSGYSISLRTAIIDKLEELEQKQQNLLPDFSNPADAAEAWAEQYRKAEKLAIEKQEAIEERDHAIITKAQISDKKTATAMNTASQYAKKNKKLEIEFGVSKDYATVKRVEMALKRKLDWQPLKKAMRKLELDLKHKEKLRVRVFDANYGKLWAWHKDVWHKAFSFNIAEL
jgi:phage regulator Rha-like protein